MSQQESDPCHDSCTRTSFTFAHHARRQVVARFDGGAITSDGGAVLLRQLEQRSGIVRQFAACFRDHRQAAQVEHSVREPNRVGWRGCQAPSPSHPTGHTVFRIRRLNLAALTSRRKIRWHHKPVPPQPRIRQPCLHQSVRRHAPCAGV